MTSPSDVMANAVITSASAIEAPATEAAAHITKRRKSTNLMNARPTGGTACPSLLAARAMKNPAAPTRNVKSATIHSDALTNS